MRKEARPDLWERLKEIAEAEVNELLDWTESETESELEEEEESETSETETEEDPEYCFGSSASEDYEGEQWEYLDVFVAREEDGSE